MFYICQQIISKYKPDLTKSNLTIQIQNIKKFSYIYFFRYIYMFFRFQI
jgi:hypothetical protein